MDERLTDPAGRRGLLVVFSGPSGVGKTTIVHAVRERFNAVFSVSATTRPMSGQEQDGVDYDFLSEDAFQRMIDDDAFLEHARVFDRYFYGTPRASVERALDEGRLVILDIDVQGAQQVHDRAPEALLIFILPPSEDELLRRLRTRGRDDEASIQRRFAEAKREIERARTSNVYDAFIVNDDLERAIEDTTATIQQRLVRVQTTP
jgi:guanylate kinase